MLAKRIVTIALLLALGNPICCCLAEKVEEASSCCSESHSDTKKPDDSCDCDGEHPAITATKLADQLTSVSAPVAIPVVTPTVSNPTLLPLPPPAHSSPPPRLSLNLLFEVFLI